ncbi:phage head closure protein [Roseibium sp. RKSG952]|uniref:phage head closure protein n=1 Tax=Roseibium sp. RKSG952 TaxID=2529384 RepID=UPI0012BB91E7
MPVVLLEPVHAVGPDGTASWSFTQAGADFAAIRLRGQGESDTAGRLDGTATHDIWLRYRPDVKSGWKLMVGSRTFRLLSVADPDAQYRKLVCRAEEEGT